MYDVFVTYELPADPAAFDAHYRDVHVPLVHAIPGLVEFTWGKTDVPDGPYVIARLTYPDAETAAQAAASPEGQAARADVVANLAPGGNTVWGSPRE